MRANGKWALLGFLMISMIPVAASDMNASAMNDYEMGSASSSLNDDPFGTPGTFNAIQLTFDNVLFKTNGSGLFSLAGFDMYVGGSSTNSPTRTTSADTTLSNGALFIGATGPCTGFANPTLGNPVAPNVITCAFSGATDMAGFPQFLFPTAGSVGMIGRSDTSLPASFSIIGLDVAETATPEPASVIYTGFGVAALWFAARRRRNGLTRG